MNYDRIDTLGAGTGNIYQGGRVDSEIDAAPFEDTLVVCMDVGEDNNGFINHSNVEAVLTVWIRDEPSACLKDNVLTGLADAIVAWVKDGGNAYLHCEAGMSRASYIDIAVHCRALGISADEALARIKAERPIANPNEGFRAQLERLFP